MNNDVNEVLGEVKKAAIEGYFHNRVRLPLLLVGSTTKHESKLNWLCISSTWPK